VIEKEVRALLPTWTACALAIVASHYQAASLTYLGLPVYLVGAAGLGAWSAGHEYAYGTMTSMLTYPVPRRRWWLAKLAVLAPSLAALAALAAYFVVIDRGDRTLATALFWVTALAALCIAPWLTVLARSPLAGAVFTIGLVGGSIAAGDWIGTYRYGFTSEVDAFRRAFLLWTVGGLSAVGAVAGWSTFARLQIAGDRGHDWQLLAGTSLSAAAPRRRRPPIVALVLKELRLQQLALAVAAVYALGNVVVLVLGRPDVYGVFELLLALYVITVPALIGSLACAEERHLGTENSQLLLPIKASHQWFVKAATAIGLALIVALLLPAALIPLLPRDAVHVGPGGHLIATNTVLIVLGSVSVSLYLSTLARSGMTAMLYAIGVIPALGIFETRLGSWVGDRTFTLVHQARAAHAHHILIQPGVYFTIQSFVVFVLAIVALALPHYRYVDRRPGLVAVHAVLVLTGIVAYSAAVNVMMALRY
jgi:hypothetical protein